MINKKARSMVSEGQRAAGSSTSAPKLGRDGRREIGRALEAMYEDVLRQGVPPYIVELLDGLDRPARVGLDPSAA
jgi:Anti-sigma factor NepR